MNKLLLLSFFTLSYSFVFGKDSENKVLRYIDEDTYSDTICIDGDMFYFNIRFESYFSCDSYGANLSRSCATNLNRGKLTPMSEDGWYLLNSDPRDLPEMDYTLQNLDQIEDDSIHIVLKFPNYRCTNFSYVKDHCIFVMANEYTDTLIHPFYVHFAPCSIYLDDEVFLNPTYCRTNEVHLTLSESDFNADAIVITPNLYRCMDLIFHYYYNGLLYYIKELSEKIQSNNIVITFPRLTEMLFNRQFFNEEMVSIHKDKVIFRGKIYTSIDESNDDPMRFYRKMMEE